MALSIPQPGRVIARDNQRSLFRSLIDRPAAQLITITGRRRVRKTFFVRNSISPLAQYLEIVGKRRSSKADGNI